MVGPEGLPWETRDDPVMAARSGTRWKPIFSARLTPTQAMSFGLAEFPPDILIVGKEAPFTHSLGPVLSFGGENRMFPRVPGSGPGA